MAENPRQTPFLDALGIKAPELKDMEELRAEVRRRRVRWWAMIRND